MSKQTAVDYLVKELGDILDARFIKPMQDLLIVTHSCVYLKLLIRFSVVVF